MGLQKGGLKLQKQKKLKRNETIFMKYILPMIMNHTTSIEIINSDSAYGFVLLIRVVDSPFVNDDGSVASEIILKVCKISNPLTCSKQIKKLSTLNKKPVGYDDFMGEAKVQQDIWESGLVNGLPQICPSLTDATVISELDIKENLIDRLFEKSSDIQQYMRSEVNAYDLGVMTMQKVEGVLMREITDRELRKKIAIFLCAVALMLFVNNKVINSDMNEGNCFFNQVTNQCTLIDYGRTITRSRAVHSINNLGRLHSDSEIDEYSKTLIEERLKEYQKLLYFFEKASSEFELIKNAIDAGRLLKVITRMEEIWNVLTLGPPKFSCIGEIVAGLDANSYQLIFEKYSTLTQRKNIPGSPLKQNTKVKVKDPEHQEFYLSKDIKNIADHEYNAIFTESFKSRFERGISSREQARLSDKRAYNAAKFAGTPESDYCHSYSWSSVSDNEFKPENSNKFSYMSNGTEPDENSYIEDEGSDDEDSHTVYTPIRVLREKRGYNSNESDELDHKLKFMKGGKPRRKTKRGFKKRKTQKKPKKITRKHKT